MLLRDDKQIFFERQKNKAVAVETRLPEPFPEELAAQLVREWSADSFRQLPGLPQLPRAASSQVTAFFGESKLGASGRRWLSSGK